MDRALENAMRKRDQIAAEINRLAQRTEECRRHLAAVDKFISDWHQFAEIPRLSASVESGEKDTAKVGYRRTRRTVKNPPRAEVVAKAREIIWNAGAPMARSALYQALAENGVRITGKDPEMVLSTMLWREPEEIMRLPKFGYWLTEMSCSQAGYEPGKKPEPDQEEVFMDLHNRLGALPDEVTGDDDDALEEDASELASKAAAARPAHKVLAGTVWIGPQSAESSDQTHAPRPSCFASTTYRSVYFPNRLRPSHRHRSKALPSLAR